MVNLKGLEGKTFLEGVKYLGLIPLQFTMEKDERFTMENDERVRLDYVFHDDEEMKDYSISFTLLKVHEDSDIAAEWSGTNKIKFNRKGYWHLREYERTEEDYPIVEEEIDDIGYEYEQ